MEQLNAILGGAHLQQNILLTIGELLLLLALYQLIKHALSFASQKLSHQPSIQNYLEKAKKFSRTFKTTLFILFTGTALTVLIYNSYHIFQGTNLQQHTLDYLNKIPDGFWSGLLLAFVKIFVLITANRYLIRFVEQQLNKLKQKSISYKQLDRNNKSVSTFFERLNQMQKVSLWLLVAYLSVRTTDLPEEFSTTLLLILKIYLIVSIALLIVNSVAVIVDSLDEISQKYAKSNNHMAFYEELKGLIPLLRRTLEYIVYATAATLILHQIGFVASLAEYGPGVIQAIGLVFIGRVIIEVINLLIDKAFLHDNLSDDDRQKNLTIFPIIKSVLAALIYFVIVILIMKGIGFDPLPLLAGAGIASMVFGLGAQPLISDILSGFFIIFEGQFKVGDFIEIGPAKGNVEKISLRTTSIRSPDGQLHILRNGKIDKVVNYSHLYVNAMVDIGVAPESDLQHITDVIAALGKELQENDDTILQPTKVLGIEDISGPEVIVRTLTQVKPGKQHITSRSIRHKILQRFKQEQILIPFEQRYKIA